MKQAEDRIVLELGDYYVYAEVGGDYTVRHNVATHSRVIATIGRNLPNARVRAVAECLKRAQETKKER